MVNNNDGYYVTKNTALAAYLRIEGFALLEVEPTQDNTPAVFIFQKESKIFECEHLWQVGKVEGNLCDFWESYRLCLKMVRVGKL